MVFLFNLRLVYASLISLLTTLLLVMFIWMMDPLFIAASFIKGTLVASDILIIIFGALFFLDVLKKNCIIDGLCHYLEHISSDYRVQAIILGWFLENFIEGTSGFGTPIAIVAPLLIGIGLNPITAVSIGLLGNSTAVVFGAAGTPIRIGFAGLDTAGVPLTSALINMVGLIVPIFILYAATANQKDHRRQFREALPFAFVSGLAFVIPSVILVLIGQEFPSIIGSVVGFLIVNIFIKLNLFVPRNRRALVVSQGNNYPPSIYKVIFPYALLILLLIGGKIALGSTGLSFNFGLSHTFNLFNPGYAFIISGLAVMLLMSSKHLAPHEVGKTFIRSLEPFLVIALISITAQLMVNSGHNLSGNISILHHIASNFTAGSLHVLAPVIGAFGSFLTGSATVSNLMFGGILQTTSVSLGLKASIILSLQLVGAAAGNMISLADILPGLAVVGLSGKERQVFRNVIIPCVLYVLLSGFVGLVIYLLT